MRSSFNFTSCIWIVLAISISGCSQFQGVEYNTPNQKVIDTNKNLFKDEVAINIIDTVKEKQSLRELNAWQAGPSGLDFIKMKFNNESRKDGWQPEIDHPDNEMNIIEHYKDGISLSNLFGPTPVKVLMNDDLILISIPNDWVWGRNYENFTIPSEPYLERLSENLGSMRARINVQSFPPNWQVTLNRQTLTTARAERVAEFISTNSHKGSVKGIGFGNTISSAKYLQDATIIEIRHPFDVNSSEFVSKNSISSFDWYAK